MSNLLLIIIILDCLAQWKKSKRENFFVGVLSIIEAEAEELWFTI